MFRWLLMCLHDFCMACHVAHFGSTAQIGNVVFHSLIIRRASEPGNDRWLHRACWPHRIHQTCAPICRTAPMGHAAHIIRCASEPYNDWWLDRAGWPHCTFRACAPICRAAPWGRDAGICVCALIIKFGFRRSLILLCFP